MKLSLSLFLLLHVLLLNSCQTKQAPVQNALKGQAIEDRIIDTILSLPEVKERATYIEKETKGERNLSVFIAAEPDSIDAYYWVKAGEDNGDAFVTHFHFFVYPSSMRIMYYDVVEDAELSLEEWRKTKQ